MKFLKSKIILTMLSLCIVSNQTQMLQAMFEAAAEGGRKGEGREERPSTEAQPTQPGTSQVSQAIKSAETAPKTDAPSVEHSNSPSSKPATLNLSEFNESRPGPNQYANDPKITNSIQKDSKSSSGTQLGKTDEFSTPLKPAEEEPTNSLINKEEASERSEGTKNEPASQLLKEESPEKIETAEKQEPSVQETKSMLEKMFDAFNKLIESFTRTINQDSSLSKEEREELKSTINTGKTNIQKALEDIKEINTNENMTSNEKQAKINEIKTTITDTQQTLAEALSQTKTGSTIHNDLIQTIDSLDSKTAEEIKNRAQKDRDDAEYLATKRRGLQAQERLFGIDPNIEWQDTLKQVNPSKNVKKVMIKILQSS